MKRFCVLMIGLCIFIWHSTDAQTVFAPLGDNVYQFIERMEINGLTGRCFNSVKPIPRTEILMYLLSIKESEKYKNLSSFEKKQLENFLEEYSYEKRFLNRDAHKLLRAI